MIPRKFSLTIFGKELVITPKKFSPTIFGIAIMCFLLPWVNVSCQGNNVLTISGTQLMTGKVLKVPQTLDNWSNSNTEDNNTEDNTEDQKIPRNYLVILVFLSACAGFALSFIKDERRATIAGAAASVIGIIFLILFKLKLDNDILKVSSNVGGVLQINYGTGVYLTFLLFLLAASINIYTIAQNKWISLKWISLLQSKDDVSGYKFCPRCGAKNESDNEFCKKCGNKFS
jgi:hypothetical protein